MQQHGSRQAVDFAHVEQWRNLRNYLGFRIRWVHFLNDNYSASPPDKGETTCAEPVIEAMIGRKWKDIKRVLNDIWISLQFVLDDAWAIDIVSDEKCKFQCAFLVTWRKPNTAGLLHNKIRDSEGDSGSQPR